MVPPIAARVGWTTRSAPWRTATTGSSAAPSSPGSGCTADHIKYRVRVGRLFPVYHSVFAVGHRGLSKEGHWMAAVLAGGAHAALSRLSRVSAKRDALRRCSPSRGRVPERLPADEVTLHDGIRVTTVPRTLFDCATILRPRQLESAMNQAELQRLAAELDGRAFHDAQRPSTATAHAI